MRHWKLNIFWGQKKNIFWLNFDPRATFWTGELEKFQRLSNLTVYENEFYTTVFFQIKLLMLGGNVRVTLAQVSSKASLMKFKAVQGFSWNGENCFWQLVDERLILDVNIKHKNVFCICSAWLEIVQTTSLYFPNKNLSIK